MAECHQPQSHKGEVVLGNLWLLLSGQHLHCVIMNERLLRARQQGSSGDALINIYAGFMWKQTPILHEIHGQSWAESWADWCAGDDCRQTTRAVFHFPCLPLFSRFSFLPFCHLVSHSWNVTGWLQRLIVNGLPKCQNVLLLHIHTLDTSYKKREIFKTLQNYLSEKG